MYRELARAFISLNRASSGRPEHRSWSRPRAAKRRASTAALSACTPTEKRADRAKQHAQPLVSLFEPISECCSMDLIA